MAIVKGQRRELVELVWKMCGGCVENVWRMCGRCVEDVWKMCGGCVEDVWRMSVMVGRYAEQAGEGPMPWMAPLITLRPGPGISHESARRSGWEVEVRMAVEDEISCIT